MTLHRYWIEFATSSGVELPLGTRLGCGVTARDYDAAVELIRERLFDGSTPPVQSVIEDIDVSTLDPGHVRPNMGSPVAPGIWFPMGYQ